MSGVLSQFGLLDGVGAQERAVLARYLVDRAFDSGAALFRAGWEADEMLLVAEGRVRLELDGSALGALFPGEVLGALAVVRVGTRECDALAEEPTRVLVLSRESYLRLCGDDPVTALRLQEAIVRNLAGQVRDALQLRAEPDPSGASNSG